MGYFLLGFCILPPLTGGFSDAEFLGNDFIVILFFVSLVCGFKDAMFGADSATTLITFSPLKMINPSNLFCSLTLEESVSSPSFLLSKYFLDFFINLNSSHSERTKFMNLSYDTKVPIKVEVFDVVTRTL